MEREYTLRIFKDPPSLRTERLVLRRMRRDDRDDMYEYASNPAVTQYLLWEPHTDRHYTARYLSYVQSRYRAGEFFDWAIIDSSSSKMIGTCGFCAIDFDNSSAEVGYVLNPAFWHLGIATEALSEVIRFGFSVLGLNRIEAKYILENTASLRVMQRAGMMLEGISRSALLHRGKYVSVGTCSILRDEFDGFVFRNNINPEY